jgi:pimeloyl-ACP methyl ester carboxylesterase
VFGYHFIESFATIVKTFQAKGWTPDQTLFAAPYDWRLAPTGLGRFWADLQALIERAYYLNNETKVIMFGYSCGGFTTQQFLSKHVNGSWKDRFIDRVIFLAPSFGGAGDTFYALWSKRLPALPYIQSTDLAAMLASMPVLGSHLPNIHIFGDREIVRDPFERGYSAKDLPKLLLENKKLVGDNALIFQKASKVSQEVPRGPSLPTYIIYNGAIQTNFAWHYRGGWDKIPASRPIGGDGTLLGETLEWACKNWDISNGPLRCMDIYRDNDDFAHTPLVSNPYVAELIVNLSLDGDWAREKGRRLVVAPYVVVNGPNYVVRRDIRDTRVLLEKDE